MPQGHFAARQKIGDSPFVSLPVGGQPVKSNNLAKYVDLSVEDLRTGVQFPPPPPSNENATLAVAFSFEDAGSLEFKPRPARTGGSKGHEA